ncbi:MAG: heme-binding protein [Planctomycetes bacterium]|nr:heme-binding protein [Planctomycetota bacterium]
MRNAAKTGAVLLLLVVGLSTTFGCGGRGGVNPVLFSPNFGTVDPLTSAEVTTIISRAFASIASPDLHIAVVDRRGEPLGVLSSGIAIADEDNIALSIARTTAFFSNSQAPLSSRTVQFISTFHFPSTFGGPFVPSVCPVSGIAPCPTTAIAPQQTTTGIAGTPQGPLWQINATNRGAPIADPDGMPNANLPTQTVPPTFFLAGQEYPRSTNVDGTFPSPGITLLPGAVPLFKMNVEGTMLRLVGGVGVFSRPGGAGTDPDILGAEFAAISGAKGSGAVGDENFFLAIPSAGAIYLNGILLPYVEQEPRRGGAVRGAPAPAPGSPQWLAGPVAGAIPPDGYLIAPRGSPLPGDLTSAEVTQVINQCVATANLNRSAIRLPLGSSAKIIATVVDTRGLILAHFRMEDTLTDAIDVVPAKARTVAYYSRPGGPDPADRWPGFPVNGATGVAVTSTALGFMSQPFFPPGIDSSGVVGPLFARATLNQSPVLAPQLLAAAPDPGYQNGAIFFPGGCPLYRNGVLVGALGVSGDGVENNDFIAAGGAMSFEPPPALRIDNFFFMGVRLPYLKFPTNP